MYGCRALDAVVGIIVVSEGGEPVLHTGSPAHPRLVESVNPHRKRLKPLLNEVPRDMIEVTAQIASRQGGQVARAINENRRLRQVVVLGQLAETLSRWIC